MTSPIVPLGTKLYMGGFRYKKIIQNFFCCPCSCVATSIQSEQWVKFTALKLQPPPPTPPHVPPPVTPVVYYRGYICCDECVRLLDLNSKAYINRSIMALIIICCVLRVRAAGSMAETRPHAPTHPTSTRTSQATGVSGLFNKHYMYYNYSPWPWPRILAQNTMDWIGKKLIEIGIR